MLLSRELWQAGTGHCVCEAHCSCSPQMMEEVNIRDVASIYINHFTDVQHSPVSLIEPAILKSIL